MIRPNAQAEFGVSASTIYGKDAFMQLTGLREGALRKARRDGLRCVYLHGRLFIPGSSFHDYVEQRAKATKDA